MNERDKATLVTATLKRISFTYERLTNRKPINFDYCMNIRLKATSFLGKSRACRVEGNPWTQLSIHCHSLQWASRIHGKRVVIAMSARVKCKAGGHLNSIYETTG